MSDVHPEDHGGRWWVSHNLANGASELVIPKNYFAGPAQITGDAFTDRWQVVILGFSWALEADGSNGFTLFERDSTGDKTIFQFAPVGGSAIGSGNASCYVMLSPASSASPVSNPASLRVSTTGSAVGHLLVWGKHVPAYGKRAWTGSPIDYNA